MTLGEFTRALRHAQILDNRAIDGAGAAVILPYGVELLQRFRQCIHAGYRAAGLAEYEYPHIVPVSVAEPSTRVLSLHDRLLLVGKASELAQGAAPLTLTPTGEMVIYAHWTRMIRSRGDLPVRMYRRARYFRPVSRGRHAGRGVFYGQEHDDVFEFHCAHAGRDDQQQDLHRLRHVVDEMIETFEVPVLWSTRPPWTNRREIASHAVAADAPLPLGVTAQLACLYDQGSRFSRAYRIGFTEHGVFHPTEQLTGYVSRRLLLAHLMLGLHQRGRQFIHPDLAPTQVLLLIRGDAAVPAPASALTGQLRRHGVSATEILCTSPAALTRCRTEWSVRGVPVIVQLFPPRTTDDRWKAVVARSDTAEEQTIHVDNPATLVEELCSLLADLAEAFAAAAWNFAASRIHPVDRRDLGEVLDQRFVAVAPLAATEPAVREIAALGKGEVLGYCRTDTSRPCILTGAHVGTVALISPRL